MDTCVIDCTHGQPLTADPVNCKNYYICYGFYDHSEFPFTCDGSEFFDTTTHSCRDSGYYCTPECEKCSFDCTHPVLGKIASLVDCNVYYECKTGLWITCPLDNPFFDGNVCQKDAAHCCTCRSQCTSIDVISHKMVPDYRNCTNFYLCIEAGFPDESSHGHCPHGNFDPQANTCKDGAPCIQPCA